jgi:tetratricopeptide (TPR) repeat protein
MNFSLVKRELRLTLAFVVGFVSIVSPATSSSVSASSPQDGDVVVRQAVEDFRKHLYSEALSKLKDNLKVYPHHAASHHLLGLILSVQRKNVEAIRHLEMSLELSPKHPIYPINLAKFYLRLKRIREAEKLLNRALKNNPSPEAYEMLGVLNLLQGQGERAIRLIEKSLEMAGDSASSWYYLGLANYSLGRFASALTCYRKALERAPRDFHIHLQLGVLHLNRGDVSEAIKHLQIAHEIRPDSPNAPRLLSQAQLASNDLNSALTSALRAVALGPHDPRVYYQLGQVHARAGRIGEAAKELRRFEEYGGKSKLQPFDRWIDLLGEAAVRSDVSP